jgi:hypothetical protein
MGAYRENSASEEDDGNRLVEEYASPYVPDVCILT